MGLKEVLGTKLLIADGAMGTLLYQYGIDRSHEELNCSHPEAILKIHQDYLAAGADIIQTNTYGANYIKLARYGLEDQVQKINRAGITLAKEARGDKEAFILGTIGGIYGAVDTKIHDPGMEEISRSFKEQLYCLLLGGVDGILLETYYDLNELKTVLAIARDATDIPIIANVSIHEVGILANGQSLATALEELADLGANVVGTNCLLGPHFMAQSFESVPLIPGKVLAAYPNASFPTMENGRIVYQKETDYFKLFGELFRKEGVGLIGGCCGTTPEHIAAYREGLTTLDLVTQKKVKALTTYRFQAKQEMGKERLLDKVQREYTVLVELDPPRTFNTTAFFKGAARLKEVGVDAITLSDNSLASARISNMALSAMLKYEYDIQPLVHLTTRDHNLIGLNSQIMGFHKLGIQDVLAVTGDPAKVGDFPGASSVFDVSSFELIKLIKNFNQGIAYTGKNLREKTNFQVAAAFNPNIPRLERAGRLLKKKQEAGADYFITQPIFDSEKVKILKEVMKTAGVTIPIFIGVIPLVSSRNAEFLHNEVPGILLTDETRERMRMAEEEGRGLEVGMTIAKELIDEICQEFNGIYLMTPFMNYEISAELCEYIQAKKQQEKSICSCGQVHSQ